ncbi:MAG: type IV pilus inner membrane component PilO [Candidatus Eutrophobiaceae bacterium]
MSFIDDLNNLDPSNPGLWPLPVKAMSFVAIFVGILAAGWHFDITVQQEALDNLEAQEEEKLGTFEDRQRKAANLNPLREQMREMEQSLGDMIRQLPDKTEVAGLLVDISQTGLAAGLEFKSFIPQNLQPSEYYSTLPIKIEVLGKSYHELGKFISGLASLPRIVTVHDINIKSSPGVYLIMDITAKTYQAIEQDDLEEK